MTELNGWVALYERVASLGFPALVTFALLGSYFGIWMWVKSHHEIVKTYQDRLDEWRARCTALEAEREKWKELTIARLSELEARARDIERTPNRQPPRRGE